GRLDDDVDAEVAPRELARVGLGEDLELVAVDDDPAARVLDGARVRAEDRVVLEQVGERLRVREVVDGDEVDVRTGRLRCPEEVPADAPEAVDPYAYGHAVSGPPGVA